MASIGKTIESLGSVVAIRLSNPFLSSYYVALAVLNWEIILIGISGDLKTEQKLLMILSKMNEYKLLWYPLAIAAVYSFCIPFVSYATSLTNVMVNMLITRSTYKMDSASHLSVSQSIELKREVKGMKKEIAELFEERQEILDRHKMQIEELKGKLDKISSEYQNKLKDSEALASEIESLKKTKSGVEAKNNALEIERNDLQLKIESLLSQLSMKSHDKKGNDPFYSLPKKQRDIIRLLANSGGSIGVGQLSEKIQEQYQKTRHYIDGLGKSSYLHYDNLNDIVQLSEKGRDIYFNRSKDDQLNMSDE